MHKNSNLSVAFCVSYTYDALGRPVTRGADRFGYNGRSEVVSALTDGVAANYAYDAIGNRLVSTNGGFATAYAANALNQYAAVTADGDDMPVEYDRWGAMTRFGAYFYDCERNGQVSFITTNLPNGRIRQVSTSGYDGLKRRIYKSVSSPAGVSHEYYYNGWNPVVERVRPSGGTTSTVRYVWGKDLSGTLQGAGGVGGLLATQVGGAWYFPAYDANGNITQYVDEDGHVVASYAYDAFGNTVAQSGAMAETFPFRFSTKYYDSESGLYYYGYRFYSPKLGRWLTRDPIEEAGGVNVYCNANNNLMSEIDFLGLVTAANLDDIEQAIAKNKNGNCVYVYFYDTEHKNDKALYYWEDNPDNDFISHVAIRVGSHKPIGFNREKDKDSHEIYEEARDDITLVWQCCCLSDEEYNSVLSFVEANVNKANYNGQAWKVNYPNCATFVSDSLTQLGWIIGDDSREVKFVWDKLYLLSFSSGAGGRQGHRPAEVKTALEKIKKCSQIYENPDRSRVIDRYHRKKKDQKLRNRERVWMRW